MKEILSIPLQILNFWYLEAPKNIFRFFLSLNKIFLGVFSLSLMLKTFFRPWKNEYREGLIGFSIFMGIAIKSMFILADLIILSGLILFEIFFLVIFLAWPILMFILPFIKL
jgi:hypothetical protein